VPSIEPAAISWKELFSVHHIVNDPKKLAELNADVPRRSSDLSRN